MTDTFPPPGPWPRPLHLHPWPRPLHLHPWPPPLPDILPDGPPGGDRQLRHPRPLPLQRRHPLPPHLRLLRRQAGARGQLRLLAAHQRVGPRRHGHRHRQHRDSGLCRQGLQGGGRQGEEQGRVIEGPIIIHEHYSLICDRAYYLCCLVSR